MTRIPLSWVNSLIDPPVDAGTADLVLGEMGVVVTAVTGLGAACRDVVVGEVLSERGEPLRISVPTPELVGLPPELCEVPARGTKVAVALPGALVMHTGGGERSGPFGTFRVVPTGRGNTFQVGRVCTEADLADGRAPVLAALPAESIPGASVREWLPQDWGEEVLSVRFSPGRGVAGRVAELAGEIVRRGFADWSRPISQSAVSAPERLGVDVPGFTAVAVLIKARAPELVIPVGDRRRHRSVGISAGESTVDEYLEAAEFETGFRFDHRVSSGEVSKFSLTAGDSGAMVEVTEVEPGASVSEFLIVTAWGPSALAGVDDYHRALLRVCGRLGVSPERAWEGVGGTKAEPRTLSMAANRFMAVTGMHPTADELEEVLRPLGIRVTTDGENMMTVLVPPSRVDIVDEESVVEEVVRRIGLSRLPGVAIRDEATSDRANSSRAEHVVRRRLEAAGWTELVTPMVVPAPPSASEERRLLGSTDAVRDSVLPELLLQAEGRSRTRGLFEIGSVSSTDGRSERRVLGLVREAGSSAPGPAAGEVMRLLGFVTRSIFGLAPELGAAVRTFDQVEWRVLRVGSEDVGRIGLSVTTGRGVTIAAEIEFSRPISLEVGTETASVDGFGGRRPVIRSSHHPVAARDLTVMLPAELSAAGFCERITATEALVADVAIVDRYQDPDSPRTWLTFRATLSSRWRSIPRSEAHQLMTRLTQHCAEWGVTLRE